MEPTDALSDNHPEDCNEVLDNSNSADGDNVNSSDDEDGGFQPTEEEHWNVISMATEGTANSNNNNLPESSNTLHRSSPPFPTSRLFPTSQPLSEMNVWICKEGPPPTYTPHQDRWR